MVATTPIIATAAPAVGRFRYTRMLETPALANGVEYFIMWFGQCGTEDIGGAPFETRGAVLDVTYGPQATTLSSDRSSGRDLAAVQGQLERSKGNDLESWNGGQVNGFSSLIADADTVIKMSCGALSGHPDFDTAPPADVRTWHGPLTIICIPLTNYMTGQDYVLRTSNKTTDTVLSDTFTSLFSETINITEPGNYLCCWCAEFIAAGQATIQDHSAFIGFSLDGSTWEPNGALGATGFHRLRDATSTGFETFGGAYSWYSIENLSAGNHTFEIHGGEGSNFGGGPPSLRSQETWGMRCAVFRADAFELGIAQDRLSVAQGNLSTVAAYADIATHEVVTAETEGFQIAIAAGAHMMQTGLSHTRSQLTQILNATSGNAFCVDAGYVRNNAAGVGTTVQPLCLIGGEDVTGLGPCTWKVQRRVNVSGTAPLVGYAADGGGGAIDSNLILWNLGSAPVPAVPAVPDPLAPTILTNYSAGSDMHTDLFEQEPTLGDFAPLTLMVGRNTVDKINEWWSCLTWYASTEIPLAATVNWATITVTSARDHALGMDIRWGLTAKDGFWDAFPDGPCILDSTHFTVRSNAPGDLFPDSTQGLPEGGLENKYYFWDNTVEAIDSTVRPYGITKCIKAGTMLGVRIPVHRIGNSSPTVFARVRIYEVISGDPELFEPVFGPLIEKSFAIAQNLLRAPPPGQVQTFDWMSIVTPELGKWYAIECAIEDGSELPAPAFTGTDAIYIAGGNQDRDEAPLSFGVRRYLDHGFNDPGSPGPFSERNYPTHGAIPTPHAGNWFPLLPDKIFAESPTVTSGAMLDTIEYVFGDPESGVAGLIPVDLKTMLQAWFDDPDYRRGDPLMLYCRTVDLAEPEFLEFEALAGAGGAAKAIRLDINYTIFPTPAPAPEPVPEGDEFLANETSIANAGLILLGEKRIDSLNDDNKLARLMAERYCDTRDGLLRLIPWNFATTRAELAPAATPPVWGFGRRYPLPDDCLRLLDLDNEFGFPHRVEGRDIVTNIVPPLLITYTRRVVDPLQMDVQFREALAAMLALELAEAITGDSAKIQQVSGILGLRLAAAATSNGHEDHPPTITSSEWSLSRGKELD